MSKKIREMRIDEQTKMNDSQANDELAQIVTHAVFCFSKKKDLRNFGLEDFEQEMMVRVFENKNRNKFIDYIKKGDSKAVYTYIFKMCRSAFRDEIQDRNIKMNTEIMFGTIVEINKASTNDIYSDSRYWTEFNFPMRIRQVKIGSRDYNKIISMASELQKVSLNKLINGEHMTHREKNSIIKLKNKVVSYQLL